LISGFTYTLGIAHLQCCFCRIGTEHEKFGFEIGTLRPMKYEQIAGLLHGIAERFDWDKIMEGDTIIGLKQVKWSSCLSSLLFHS
jgi:gamma-glutamylcysteine synthetase